MPLKLFAPGTRKSNRHYIAKGSIAGRQYEIVCRDEAGLKTADARAAGRYAKRFTAAAQAQAERERRQPADRTPATFSEVADQYADARGISRVDRGFVERLKGELGGLQIVDIVPADIAAAATAIYPTCTNETKNRQAYVPAAAILHFAAANGWRDYLVVAKLKERQPETRRPAPGVPQLLLASTDGKRRLLLLFLFCQGWRIGEALSLRDDRVHMTTREIEVYVSKSRRWKRVPMHPAIFEAFANADPESTGYWFPWRARASVYKWLWPLTKRLGVAFTPHMARHEFGGALREVGATGRDLVDVGTWTNSRSTERYQSASNAHAQRIISLHYLRGTARGTGTE